MTVTAGDRPPAARREWLALLPAAAAVALVFRRALLGEVLFRRDINMVWLPQVEAFVRGVASGAWPLWDPWRGFGTPLLADPRAGILYPLTWLNLVVPPGPFYTAYVVLHLLFAAWGMQRLALRLGASPLAAGLAATAAVVGGPLLSLASMWHQLAAAAWIPWVFLAADRLIERPGPRRAIVLAVTITAQVFAGSPDCSALTLLGLGPWLFCRRPTKSGLGSLGVAAVLAVGLAAAQWIPTLDVAREAARVVDGARGPARWSMHPALLAETVLPVMFWKVGLSPEARDAWLEGGEPLLHSLHMGAPMLALALLGVGARDPRAPALALIAGTAQLLALGRHAPLHGLVVDAIPPLGVFRYPVKAMVFVAFPVSILAALGFDRWRLGAVGGTARAAGRTLLGLATAGAAAGVAAGLWAADAIARGERPLPWDASGTIGRFAAAGALSSFALALLMRRSPSRAAMLGLLGAVVAGPAAAHLDLHPTAPPALFALRPPAAEILAGERSARIYVEDHSMTAGRELRVGTAYRLRGVPAGFSPGSALVLAAHLSLVPPTAARWGLRGSHDADVLDFDPAPRARLTRRVRSLEHGDTLLRMLRAVGVQHALFLLPGPGLGPLAPRAVLDGLFVEPLHVFRVPGALPRAWLVDGVRVADGAEAEELLGSASFDPAREVILPVGLARPPGADTPGTARVASERADRVRVEVDSAREAWLVLAEGHARGWRATVDGAPAPLVRANVVLRAVPVPAGRHHVDFVYRPSPILLGLALSGTTLAAALGAWCLYGRAT